MQYKNQFICCIYVTTIFYDTVITDQNVDWGSRNLVGIIVSYSHPKFRPLPHGNKSIGGVGSHRASL